MRLNLDSHLDSTNLWKKCDIQRRDRLPRHKNLENNHLRIKIISKKKHAAINSLTRRDYENHFRFWSFSTPVQKSLREECTRLCLRNTGVCIVKPDCLRIPPLHCKRNSVLWSPRDYRDFEPRACTFDSWCIISVRRVCWIICMWGSYGTQCVSRLDITKTSNAQSITVTVTLWTHISTHTPSSTDTQIDTLSELDRKTSTLIVYYPSSVEK